MPHGIKEPPFGTEGDGGIRKRALIAAVVLVAIVLLMLAQFGPPAVFSRG